MNQRIGSYVDIRVGDDQAKAYIPPPLPPDPAISISGLEGLLERASRELGVLSGLTRIMPQSHVFVYSYVRKEALLSSQIEGTQSSLSDLFLFELDQKPSVPFDDVVEVSNYVSAASHGLERIRQGQPISLWLIRSLHRELLSKGRGSDQTPGEFRTRQVWIGGSRIRPSLAEFVPPPPEFVPDCMSDLTRYIAKEEPAVPLLMKAALMHVQFETIHPFLDGNGRLGRLLITLLLCAAGALGEPTLYLSLYFKRNRQSYYALLNAVRTHGAWEEWLAFFLTGVAETAREAADTAQRLHDLFSSDQEKVERIGRRAATAFRLFRLLIRTPVLSVQYAVEKLDLQPTTIGGALDALVKLDIIRETTGRGRNRLFAYDAYLRILAEGTEP